MSRVVPVKTHTRVSGDILRFALEETPKSGHTEILRAGHGIIP